MRHLSCAAAAIALCSLAACGDGTSPDGRIPAALVGQWASPDATFGGNSTSRNVLVIERDGTWRLDHRSYGGVNGEPAGALTHWSRSAGRARVSGDSLYLEMHFFSGSDVDDGIPRFRRLRGDQRSWVTRFQVTADTLVREWRGPGPSDGIAEYREQRTRVR